MATLTTIPLDENLPDYSFSCTLDGASYTLRAYYNTRARRWRLNILDISENPVLMGIPLTIGRDLTAGLRYLQIPPGVFMALDDTGDGTQPTLGSFLLDHSLYYLGTQ